MHKHEVEGLMRAPIGLLVTAVLAWAMVGCTPDVQPTPDPPSASPTQTPTPTPTWTADEQAAVDAVARFMDVWAGITQRLPDVDQMPIRDVTGDPLRSQTFLAWDKMVTNGWHLVGTPIFVPDYVTPGAHDYQGDRYHVHGCYTNSNTHIADKTGKNLGDGPSDREATNYLVLHLLNEGIYLVLEENPEGKPC